MDNTVIITGSTGFVARHLCQQLLKQTHLKIVMTYRKNTGDYISNPRLFFEKADLFYPEDFEKIIVNHKPKYFIHLAAMARVNDGIKFPGESVHANLVATLKLMDICINHGVQTFVNASSNLAQNAVSIVGISKLLCEQYSQNADNRQTRLINFRIPNVIDSNGAVTLIFKKLIKENRAITITHPDMSRMFISGDDAATWIQYLMENGDHKGIYVSYKDPVNITDIAKEMITKSRKKLPITFIGMKPGEKLNEHCFKKSDVVATKIPFLGKLKNYSNNNETIIQSINTIKENIEDKYRDEISSFIKNRFKI